MKPLIYDFDLSALTEIVTNWGEPAYRAVQIWQGVYRNFWNAPEAFTPLPKNLRERLAETFTFQPLTPTLKLDSRDGQTRKTLFRLADGLQIEAVLMRYDNETYRSRSRRTLCISTQAGCAMGCVFCATGQMGFRRHLTSGEIVAQVMYYARLLQEQGETVTNIVLMGMGEPFHNYDNTMAAIDRLNDPQGYNFGARRFTISTSGLVPAIRRFAAEKRQVNLAVSLHAVEDEARSAMMPVNKKYPIAELLAACREYAQATGRRVTFEWALIEGVNDTPETARKLADLLQGLLCHVNAIPLNPTRGYSGRASGRERAEEFRKILEARGIPCTVRVRRGIDIQAGCGQLAARASSAEAA
ncbi:MAG: 23S rRNA (adenine(2503)-C(2))-methyltransferase RlmN [Anaerolineales bacterium]|nr:23S rRNA (adenine(2503)-C(2))-methyltransferase RlmN [Anaerolineales bacterium]MCX7753803.1 23S rRNA (adenine(2503)-C(2))-methyltransferase RlmN [Anaerolineales bacterium]MDW8276399.1 23S rRNA (adenine(2503)-C(2))-methyltransferase RlmN [Anaerolineales bacterium]